MLDRMEIDERSAKCEPRAEVSWPPVFVLATGAEPAMTALRTAAVIRDETGARISDIFRQLVDGPSTVIIGTARGWFRVLACRC